MGTRERILDAATAVIKDRGLANATTKESAREVGLSEAMLYKHFASKHELSFTCSWNGCHHWPAS